MRREWVVAGGIAVLALFIGLAGLGPHLFGADEKTVTLIAHAIGTSGVIGLLIYALKARFNS